MIHVDEYGKLGLHVHVYVQTCCRDVWPHDDDVEVLQCYAKVLQVSKGEKITCWHDIN